MDESAVFSAALAQPPNERAAFLRRACGGDAAMLARLAQLLSAHDAASGFLRRPAAAQNGPSASASPVPSSNDMPDAPAQPGTIGPYRILDEVGRGGMGTVYRAFDPKLQRVVALKLLSADLAASAVARQRFEREARTAAAISHPHVVVIHAVDETHRPPYLVMEFVQGRSLAEKLAAEGALPLAAVLRIAAQVAEGLAAAHRQGVIHRDVKPANILLENGVERVKLTDFGLAKAWDDAGISRSGEVSGTPLFMSPEQCRGERLDQRSDLFSLGAVIYTMAAGVNPFRGESALAVMRNICDGATRPLREARPDVPAWLGDVVGRLLEKQPEARFASAGEVAEILQRQLARLQGPQAGSADDEHRGGLRGARRSSRLAWAAAASAGVLLASLLLGLALRSLTWPALGTAANGGAGQGGAGEATGAESAPAANGGPSAGTATRDLLPLFDPNDSAGRGAWRLADGLLLGRPDENARTFALPLREVEVPAHYRLTIVCRRVGPGRGALVVGLESGGSWFFARVDHTDDGKPYTDIMTFGVPRERLRVHRRVGVVLRADIPARLVFEVTPEALTIDADGEQVYRWEGDFSRLSRGSNPSSQAPLVIGGVAPAEFAFSEILLETLEQ